MNSVENSAAYYIELKSRGIHTELTQLERDVLYADIGYRITRRCNCNRIGGVCRCYEDKPLSPEHLEYIVIHAHCTRATVTRILNRLQAKAELREYYGMAWIARDLHRQAQHRRSNYPAPGQQQRRKRGRPGYHADLKRAAIEMVKRGKSLREVEDKLHIGKTTIERWVNGLAEALA